VNFITAVPAAVPRGDLPRRVTSVTSDA